MCVLSVLTLLMAGHDGPDGPDGHDGPDPPLALTAQHVSLLLHSVRCTVRPLRVCVRACTVSVQLHKCTASSHTDWCSICV